MCLILIKPAKVPMPNTRFIENAWQSNNDGFGLAYSLPGEHQVHIRKGAMKLKHVKQLIAAMPNPLEANIMMHFRYATEGKICPENCHPYPVTKYVTKLRATSIDCNMAITHNGMIPSANAYGYYDYATGAYAYASWPDDRKLTDTQQFIIDHLANLHQSLLNPAVGKLIEAYTGSKFAILSPRGVYLIGKFIEDKGILYSNATYKATPAPVKPAALACSPAVYRRDHCDLCGELALVHSMGDMQVCVKCEPFYHQLSDDDIAGFEACHYLDRADYEAQQQGKPPAKLGKLERYLKIPASTP